MPREIENLEEFAFNVGYKGFFCSINVAKCLSLAVKRTTL